VFHSVPTINNNCAPNRLTFVTEIQCFLQEVESELLNIINGLHILKATSTWVFLVFLSLSKCCDSSQVSSWYCMLFMQPSHYKGQQNYLLAAKATKLLVFLDYIFHHQRIKTSRPPSQATTSYHPNVLAFILSLAKGQAGEVWEHTTEVMLFLPWSKFSLLSLWFSLCAWSHNISLNYLSYYKRKHGFWSHFSVCDDKNGKLLGNHVSRESEIILAFRKIFIT
jgi:hypothetical protein